MIVNVHNVLNESFIYLHLGCFQFYAINYAAADTCEYMFVLTLIFPWAYRPKSKITVLKTISLKKYIGTKCHINPLPQKASTHLYTENSV